MVRSFIKFGTLSGGGWLLDCGILLILSQTFGITLSIANFLSSSIAALIVFSTSRFLVFNSPSPQSVKSTAVYFVYTCLIIIAASSVIGQVEWVFKYISDINKFELTAGQLAFVAKVIVTTPQLLANFIVSRYLLSN